MEYNYFVGIDVSKNKLDFAVMCGKRFLFHKEINNTPEAILAFIKELLQLPGFALTRFMVYSFNMRRPSFSPQRFNSSKYF